MIPARFAFLHGGAQGSWVWDSVIAQLERAGHRCLALDVPGCGTKRGRDTGGIAFPDIVDELLGDIDAAGLSDVILVGHSQAGTVVPKMAEARPGLFRQLVYLSCSLPLPGQTIIEMIGTSLHGQNPDEVGWPLDPAESRDADRWEVMFCSDMDEATIAHFRANSSGHQWPMSSYAWRDWAYPAAAAPSTYILCERDQALPPDWQEIFAERLHCSRTNRMDCDHQAMLTRPGELAGALSEIAGNCP